MNNQPNVKTVYAAVTFCLVAFIILFLICFNMGQPDRAEAKAYDDIAYFSNFSLETADHSSSFGNNNLSNNKITVINGWAPWCPGCIKEMPDLEILSRRYEGSGLQIVGIVPDYSKKAASESSALDYDSKIDVSIQSTGVTYPIILADSQFYEEVYPTTNDAMPTTWVVDSNGRIIDIVSGAKSESDWVALFDKWLSES